ncbi:hypothetical protein [Variovorax boronicumulans]
MPASLLLLCTEQRQRRAAAFAPADMVCCTHGITRAIVEGQAFGPAEAR